MRPSKKKIKEAVEALEKLESVPGRLNKESLLEQYSDNEILRNLFRMALDGTMYHIHPSSNLISTIAITDSREAYTKFVKLASKLSNQEITGYQAAVTSDRFLSSIPGSLKKWFTRVMNHDLRVGVSEKTISKVWGKEFWETKEEKDRGWRFHGCSLAKKYEDVFKSGKMLRFPVSVEPKLDGERALVFCFPSKDRIYVLTRGNKRRTTIESVGEFKDQILSFCSKIHQATDISTSKPIFLDGEFLAQEGWNRTSSIVRSTKNFSAKTFLDEVRMIIFDWSWMDSYMDGEFNLPWKDRKKILMKAAGAKKVTSETAKISDNVALLGHQIIYDDITLHHEYERFLDQGLEGIVIKKLDAPHTFKRTENQIKLKPEDEATGTIVELCSGKGKNGSASARSTSVAKNVLKQWGEVEDDGYYLHCKTKHPKAAAQDLQDVIKDSTDRRISLHRKGKVSFRYSERLGYFVVERGKTKFHVGGGLKHKAGNDQRMKFWQRREELIGTKVDFRKQKEKKEVAVARFNRFVRLREDLS